MCRRQHPAHLFTAPKRTKGRVGRPHPHRHRKTFKIPIYEVYKNSPECGIFHRQGFFLENQIVCIVSREGTKFCSLIENRLFMRSDSRHISKRMQMHIMYEIHEDICRLLYGGEPVG